MRAVVWEGVVECDDPSSQDAYLLVELLQVRSELLEEHEDERVECERSKVARAVVVDYERPLQREGAMKSDAVQEFVYSQLHL